MRIQRTHKGHFPADFFKLQGSTSARQLRGQLSLRRLPKPSPGQSSERLSKAGSPTGHGPEPNVIKLVPCMGMEPMHIDELNVSDGADTPRFGGMDRVQSMQTLLTGSKNVFVNDRKPGKSQKSSAFVSSGFRLPPLKPTMHMFSPRDSKQERTRPPASTKHKKMRITFSRLSIGGASQMAGDLLKPRYKGRNAASSSNV